MAPKALLSRRGSLTSFVSVLVVSGAVGCTASDPGAQKVGHTGGAVVVCSGGSTVQGIDVSEFQGSISWGQVAASGRGFAIARVSDGTGHPDPTFAANWEGIKAAGMVRGVYQFFRASEDPTAQANIVVGAIGRMAPGDLPPVADVEVMDGQSGATLVTNLATWVNVIEARLGVTPMIYSAPGFWDPLPSTGQFAGETLWVANWQVNCPDTPTPWGGWAFWQYADNGSVPGIAGPVDLDEFNGASAALDPTCGPAPPPSTPLDAGAPPPMPSADGGAPGEGWTPAHRKGGCAVTRGGLGTGGGAASLFLVLGGFAVVGARRRWARR
jgi:lysozyme